jgi:hypothetical protein
MRRTMAIMALLGLAVDLAGSLTHAQQFSAKLVSSNASGQSTGTQGQIYVADGKARIETPEFPHSFLIVDTLPPASYLVRPAQRIFMDSKQSSRLTRLFVPLDPTDPCAQWRTMAAVAGLADTGTWHCQAGKRVSLEGRSTVKFTVLSPRGHSTRWIDPQLRFPLRIEDEGGAVFELQNVRQEPQPADKFEIPAGYRKFDPRLVLEQLKHTDIWVEPPH